MKKYKINFGKIIKTRGSALMEVLISIFIVTMGLTGATMLIVTAIKINSINADRIIALNLAREGIEAVRNIRDTNWMTWSANIRECWNFWSDTNEDGLVDGSDDACIPDAIGQNKHPIGRKKDGVTLINDYIVNFDSTNFRWTLIDANSLPANYSKKLYINSDGLYTHDSTVPNDETEFSREITIKYIDNEDTSVDPVTYYFPLGEKDKDNRILIESKVSWYSRGRNQELTLAQTLTDYLGRTNWDD